MKIALYIKESLLDNDVDTYLIGKLTEHGFDFDQDNPDFVIVVGGDGTFLKAVHSYIDSLDEVQFVAINGGSLGFYSDYVLDEIDELLISLSRGDYNCKTASLLEGEIGDKVIYAVNEIRVESPLATLLCDVEINGTHLEKFSGNGLVVSSSLGSTAYNKSLGGAVVLGDIDVMELTEIAPINNRIYHSLNSPMVLVGEDNEIVLKGDFSNCVVGYDCFSVNNGLNSLKMKISGKKLTFIYKNERNFIDKIRDNLVE